MTKKSFLRTHLDRAEIMEVDVATLPINLNDSYQVSVVFRNEDLREEVVNLCRKALVEVAFGMYNPNAFLGGLYEGGQLHATFHTNCVEGRLVLKLGLYGTVSSGLAASSPLKIWTKIPCQESFRYGTDWQEDDVCFWEYTIG